MLLLIALLIFLLQIGTIKSRFHYCKRFAQSAGPGYENCLHAGFPSVQVAQTVPCTQFFGSFLFLRILINFMHELSILGALLELLLLPWGHVGSTLAPFLVFRNQLGLRRCPRSPPRRSPRISPQLFGAILKSVFRHVCWTWKLWAVFVLVPFRSPVVS